ncbi:hypothetical protein GCM10010965_26940 [Caldalkalibacillus thermarum]|uniref:ISL3 family transposase n=2 Tax=Caldalkalibacillus thermarum TaxID=296745 RepID=UPI00166316CF|nr:ISL3 family transposase [Caldalkalibacillus thermarum]GGK32663.1 hypothetical protein GCM10010965_26940 [Caldalkalibacillus thermarum]
MRKGHVYETVVTDLVLGQVHEMRANRDYESALDVMSTFCEQDIHLIVMDMWRPYYKAAQTLFPHATIVIDKYHVVQKVNQAFDVIRKSVSKELKGVKNGRFALLKRHFRLTDKQNKKLDEYHSQSEELAYAYYLKEWFYDLYEQHDSNQAETFLDTWIQAALQSPFKPFHDFSKTLVTWKTHILAYFRLPYTNARTEGTNHKIKNLKRRAYGYRNRERFRLRVKLECGCFQQAHSLLHFTSA